MEYSLVEKILMAAMSVSSLFMAKNLAGTVKQGKLDPVLEIFTVVAELVMAYTAFYYAFEMLTILIFG